MSRITKNILEQVDFQKEDPQPFQNADPNFLLTHKIQDQNFLKCCDQIVKNGLFSFIIDSHAIKIYNINIAEIMTEKLSVLNSETNEEIIINGFEYIKSYVLGFREGIEYFNNEIKGSVDTLYQNTEYVENIQNHYLRLKSIKDSPFHTFNHDSIKKFGYESGIVGAIEDLKKEHHSTFENLEKLNNDIEAPGKKKKPCKSLMRARAFCILLLQEAGMEAKYAQKKELKKIVKKRFPEQSGQPIYEEIKLRGLDLNNEISQKKIIKYFPSLTGKHIKYTDYYKDDYEYGLVLFNNIKAK
jgi:uncharacterized protein YbcV (DUF1398 family)